jgi:hypothetical protein
MNVAWVRAGDVAAGVERVFRLLGSGPEPESFNTASRRERNVVSLPSVASGEVAVAGLKRSRWWAERHEDRPDVSTRRRCSAKRDDSGALQLKCARRGTQSFRQPRQRNLQ